MNRIELASPSASLSLSLPTYPAASPHNPFSLDRELRTRIRHEDYAHPQATVAPIHYEPGYAYPLIVWLHGAAGNEREVKRVMPLVSMRNYVAVAPRGTSAHRAQPGAFGWRQTLDEIELAEARVVKCVELAKSRFHINPDRVFLAGYGCGGTMAVRVAWNNPSRFAGVAAMGGGLPSADQPLRHVKSLRQMPCFLAAARRSCAYPEPAVCRDLRLLHAVGCDVDLRQYPCGDELTTNMLADLDRWAMGIIGASHS